MTRIIPPAPTPPRLPFLCGNNNAFARITLAKRLPTIITKCIDQLHRESIALPDNPASAELKQLISKISGIKYEMV
jgi:hypothetical protein